MRQLEEDVLISHSQLLGGWRRMSLNAKHCAFIVFLSRIWQALKNRLYTSLYVLLAL